MREQMMLELGLVSSENGVTLEAIMNAYARRRITFRARDRGGA